MVANSERNGISSEQSIQNGTVPPRNYEAELHLVRHKLEAFHSNLLHEVQQRMSDIVNDLEKDLRQHELQIREFQSPITTINSSNPIVSFHENNKDSYEERYSDRRRKEANQNSDMSKEGQQKSHKQFLKKNPEKVFQCRESYLTTLMQVGHIRTIYNIFIVGFVFYLMQNVLLEYLTSGRITLGAGIFQTGFANIHYALGVWLILNAYTCSVYYALKIWSNVRSKLHQQEKLRTIWSYLWLMGYILGVVMCLYLPAKFCFKLDIKYASAAALLMETLRLVMKQHAFVRTICGRAMQGKLKSDDTADNSPTMPPFSKYLYYLFVPTFLYRDNYPRTSCIRWGFVAARFVECVAHVFLFACLMENHLKPGLENFGKMQLNASLLVRTVFQLQMTSMLMLLSGFYFLLHSWSNLTAELLRFGDRMFYRDWWTSGDIFEYFRKWNILVGDWLYEYIFKDCYLYVFKGSTAACGMAVFVISAIAHE
ncbi:sterol O-acyltransferase 1-like [Musca domestica]|nr:sterol O-acyltransferase 1-like [Musca domestica]